MSTGPVAKCINFRICPKADSREIIPVAARDPNPVCPNCSEPLLVSTPVVNPRKNAFVAIAIVGVFALVGLGFALRHTLKSGSIARDAVPAAIAATVPASAVAAAVRAPAVALGGTRVETRGLGDVHRADPIGTIAAPSMQSQNVTIPVDAPSAYANLVRAAHKADVALYFKSGSGILDNQANGDVGRLASALKTDRLHGRKVVVAGFADNTGDPEYSKSLSAQRAQTVAAELASRGVAVAQTFGFGQSAPIGDNATAAGRGENRRVEIFIAR